MVVVVGTKRSLSNNEFCSNNGDGSCGYYENSSRRKSGKWTSEEVAFAKQLIAAFMLGNLDDCEEGSTLRSYLARKLHCSPMRVSKKFAGQGIGKYVYTKHINQYPFGAKASVFPQEGLSFVSSESRNDSTPKSYEKIVNPTESNFAPRTNYINNELWEEYQYNMEPDPVPFMFSNAAVSYENINEPQQQAQSQAVVLPTVYCDVDKNPFAIAEESATKNWNQEESCFVSLDCSSGTTDCACDSTDTEAEVWKSVLTYYCGSVDENHHFYI